MRLSPHPTHAGRWQVYADDDGHLAAFGHLEIMSVPVEDSPWNAVPVLFVADWTAEQEDA